ncbi:hypothetical protein GCM10027614_60800 [Micromonospora vulcania]
MSRELSDLYRSLAADADARDLGVPNVLRQRADRRARLRAAGSTLAVALVVGAVVIGTQLVGTPPPDTVPPPAGTPTPPPLPTPTPSETPASPPPTTSPISPGRPAGTTAAPPRTPTSIPDRAFFVLASTNRTGYEPTFLKREVLPALCGAGYPSEAAVVQRRTRSLVYKLAKTPERYGPDGSYTLHHHLSDRACRRCDE